MKVVFVGGMLDGLAREIADDRDELVVSSYPWLRHCLARSLADRIDGPLQELVSDLAQYVVRRYGPGAAGRFVRYRREPRTDRMRFVEIVRDDRPLVEIVTDCLRIAGRVIRDGRLPAILFDEKK
jgi:hypothetical protein